MTNEEMERAMSFIIQRQEVFTENLTRLEENVTQVSENQIQLQTFVRSLAEGQLRNQEDIAHLAKTQQRNQEDIAHLAKVVGGLVEIINEGRNGKSS